MTLLRRLPPAVSALLLALAIMGRALLPTGWMPVSTEGGVRITLCTGAGPVVATLVADGSVQRESGKTPHDPCPFGLAGAAALDAPPLPVLASPPVQPVAQFFAALIVARLVAWRALRPPARGPPHFA